MDCWTYPVLIVYCCSLQKTVIMLHSPKNCAMIDSVFQKSYIFFLIGHASILTRFC